MKFKFAVLFSYRKGLTNCILALEGMLNILTTTSPFKSKLSFQNVNNFLKSLK